MDQKYWIMIALWAGYFALHSYLASTRVKSFSKDRGVSGVSYRKIYVLISTLGFFALLVYNSSIPERPLLQPSQLLRYVSLVLAAAGTIVIRAAFKQYNVREFLGLSEENPGHKFVSSGILNYVRHPTYSGTILVVMGYFMFSPKLSNLILSAMVVVYVIIGIYFEEKKLIIELGQHYKDYKKDVPALVPRLDKVFKS